MAYADPLDATIPADTDFSGQGDDRIRELKRALQQRIQSFFQNIEAQPWVPIVGIIPGASIANNSITSAQLDTTTSRAWLAGFFISTAANPPVPAAGTIPVNALVGAVTIPDNSITTIKLVDLNVTEPKLAAGSGSTRVLADLGVTEPKLAAGAGSTRVLADSGVTQPKLDPVLVAKIPTMVTANRLFTQAETTVADSAWKEYDIACPGAMVGKPVIAVMTATGWPDGVAAGGAWIGPDELGRSLHAWCLVADTIRVRLFNKTGTTIDAGVGGATINVWQILWLDRHG